MASIGAGTGHTVRVLSLVGSTHFMSHVYYLALPPLFPLLVRDFDTSYTALGFLLTVFAVATSLVATPIGFVIDRLGGRRVLIYGLTLQAFATGAVAFTSSYWALVVLFAIAGLAFSVYHPADYAIMSSTVDKSRLGRAFSVHAVAGNLGSAAAPLMMVGMAALWGWRSGFIALGALGLLLALILWSQGSVLEDDAERRQTAEKDGTDSADTQTGRPETVRAGLMLLLSAPVMLCFLFYVISHIGFGGLRIFAVSALVAMYDTPLAAANGALTGYLIGSACGIIAGGFVADKFGARMTTAAFGMIVGAGLIVLIGTVSLPMVLIITTLSAAGFMRATVQATRDLIVLSVTPKGSTGKVFAFLYNGTMIGAAIMPLLFGWVMDSGRPEGVFWLTAAFMMVALATFFGLRRAVPLGAAENSGSG